MKKLKISKLGVDSDWPAGHDPVPKIWWWWWEKCCRSAFCTSDEKNNRAFNLIFFFCKIASPWTTRIWILKTWTIRIWTSVVGLNILFCYFWPRVSNLCIMAKIKMSKLNVNFKIISLISSFFFFKCGKLWN